MRCESVLAILMLLFIGLQEGGQEHPDQLHQDHHFCDRPQWQVPAMQHRPGVNIFLQVVMVSRVKVKPLPTLVSARVPTPAFEPTLLGINTFFCCRRASPRGRSALHRSRRSRRRRTPRFEPNTIYFCIYIYIYSPTYSVCSDKKK